MKKVLFLLCIMLLGCQAYGANTLQTEYENQKGIKNELSTLIGDGQYLLKDDFRVYESGSSGSLYGVLTNLSDKFTKEHKTADLKYIQLTKQYLYEAYNSATWHGEIEIEDSIYSVLQDETKHMIASYNAIVALQDRKLDEIDFEGIRKKIEDKYYKFLSNKNNLKENYTIYEELLSEKKGYENYLNYYKINYPNEKVLPQELDKLIFYLKDTSGEIYRYGYHYEEKKFKEWAARNNKKVLCPVSLSAFIYQPYAPAPQTTCLYEYLPQRDFTLQAFQSIPGGVIISGSYQLAASFGGSTVNSIFLQTSKNFADGQRILEPLMVEYKGMYDYTTVLGAKKRIYKFYRLGQKEIEANFHIPGQPFYFYSPY